MEEALEVLLIVAPSAIAAEVEWELEKSAMVDQSLKGGEEAATEADTQRTAMEWAPWVLVEEVAEAVLGTTVDTLTTTTAMGTAVGGCLATEWKEEG